MWKLDFLDSYLTCTAPAMRAVYASSLNYPILTNSGNTTTIDGLGSVRLEALDRLFAVVTHYAVHFAILPPFYPVRFASARLYFPNLSVLIAQYIELTMTPWLLYNPRHTSSTHLQVPLMKFLLTLQNNWFCTKNPPKRNGLINYPHPAVKSILYQRNLLLFSFSPYPISHFAISFTTTPSQLVKLYS